MKSVYKKCLMSQSEEEPSVSSVNEEYEESHEDYQLPAFHIIKSNIFYYFIIMISHLWNVVCTIILIVLQSLKLYHFPGPTAARNFSMVAPFLWFIINIIKLQLGKLGNQSENLPLIIATLVLTIGSIFFGLYFILWQLYVWSWELPIIIVSMIFDGILLIFSIILIIMFAIKN